MRHLYHYPFPLGDGSFGELRLPPDITQNEVDRLKQFLDALVIAEGTPATDEESDRAD